MRSVKSCQPRDSGLDKRLVRWSDSLIGNAIINKLLDVSVHKLSTLLRQNCFTLV